MKAYPDISLSPDFKTGIPSQSFELDGYRREDIPAQFKPQRVFLFSGHMIDAPDRPVPRFPAAQENVAARAISATLDSLGAAPGDLAICSGACGGDILFAEACLQRGVRLEIWLPFVISVFLEKSVSFAGQGWSTRFYAIQNNPLAAVSIIPGQTEFAPDTANPYARTNLWLLQSALGHGEEKIHFICLWNRRGGDGTGGTEHMHDEVYKRTGQVHVLDTNILFAQGETP